ncbi:sugar phosphate isomerase/epimerase [Sphaerisporangium album]|uniref:Sugar phosphate isomerase/epimerase n=1 Tax=Sphaerisporangium album TaxID=509200 RepID=A0A367FIK0_9ACTN|nr:sugar phosphate isomerase/epimerase family protein [Sphaerisporangium album]RCG29642.1 sugar phosphate isomerase/epimerase [Sphaerisporangium album]
MKLGFLTACLPESDLSDIARWAAEQGFQALEVAAWPAPDPRNHIRVDQFDEAESTRVKKIFEETGLTLSSIAYYDNNLHPTRRAGINAHLRRCVDAAAELGCPTVGTFVGRDPGLTVDANLKLAEEVFAPVVEHAARRGVTIVIENCVMKSWHPDGYPGNLAYSPELWEWMFTLGLKLNYDPSHLVGLGIDPIAAVTPYVDRIAHVQAKDTQILPGRIDRYGFYGPLGGDKGWYRFRVPGLGQVDWARLIDVLYEGGYDGVISVEHEDPVWSGDPAKVRAGLGIAYRTLHGLIVG